jgi:hypothetical protein
MRTVNSGPIAMLADARIAPGGFGEWVLHVADRGGQLRRRGRGTVGRVRMVG